jgi:hypothetical protein
LRRRDKPVSERIRSSALISGRLRSGINLEEFMSSLEQVVERALDDIIVALVVVEAGDPTRWRDLEAAANRIRKAARELYRTEFRSETSAR